MRRKDREITDINEIKAILEGVKVLHLGLFDGEYPYIVPMHYGFEFKDDNPIFYMHCAKEGTKLDIIRECDKACIEIEGETLLVSAGDVPCNYGATFSSVMAKGTIEILANEVDKIHGIELLMKHQTGRDFEINAQMAKSVEVLRFVPEMVSGKARRK